MTIVETMPVNLELTADGKLNTKSRRVEICGTNADAYPVSYQRNTDKEDLCQEYVESFLSQFKTYYPNRRAPFLLVPNELGVRKLVCTTLRPTQLPIPELYDLHECASFLAGYLIYEPLQPATEHPSYLFSPTQTLASYTGDSFDIATLMCSFLLGANYDAFVVCGYAPKYITLRDQSLNVCPLIGGNKSSVSSTDKSDTLKKASNLNKEIDEAAYGPPKDPQLSSLFLQEEAEKERLSKIDKFQLWNNDALDTHLQQRKNEIESSNERRCHAWILIRPGRRDIKETLFVEPTTGRVYNMSNNAYLGIEAIWNHTNYWINLNETKRPNEINFDLRNQCWESLFYQPVGAKESKDNEEFTEGENTDSGLGEGYDNMKTFDVPPSWVSPLTFERARYLLRYPPNGIRTVNYFATKVDYYAKGVHSQSMVMKITSYLDKECTRVSEIHEWYESRKDRLYKRIRSYLGERHCVELYHPGSIGEIKQLIEYPGKRREVDFFVDGRLDRMIKRIEVLGRQIEEIYSGRTDHMVSRTVDLTIDKAVAGPRQFTIPGGSLASELYILKINLNYERDPSVEAGTDIARRTYFIKEGKYVVTYHYCADQITCKVNTYLHTRGPSIPGVSDHAIAQEVGVIEDPDALLEASASERETYANIKLSVQAIAQMEEQRVEFERSIAIERNVFEVALNKSNGITQLDATSEKNEEKSPDVVSTQVRADDAAKEIISDYLTPYIRNVKDMDKLTKEEAIEIRQACLDALKSRLVERANIIQARLNEENAKLGRKQEQFQRSQREGDISTEEYEKYCTEAMFRIQILEQRLAVHEETALKKFADLDSKLSSDPRLRILKK